jgi:hydrogenase maturation protein HypF
MPGTLAATRRARVRVTGVVQGVGFRPFVHRLAGELSLTGHVRNDARGVEIEVEGPPERLDLFLARLPAEAPPLASVESVTTDELAASGDATFVIADTVAGPADTPVTADAATCDDCLRELFDPGDRRYRYPFVNCTNCGPRFTIVRGVPYDRPLTTMSGFTMCAACRAEYDDPADRRFHAQPNACPECGPRAWLAGGARAVCGDEAMAEAASLLRGGAILAVKGVGGYHLACRAGDAGAVDRLRGRKHREDRPFALMVAGVAAAHELVYLDDAAVGLLTAPARPIVLAPRVADPRTPVADGVAPGVPELGVMLPYAPLHHLLVRDAGSALVMTSGNVSDEPIAYRDDDALGRLSGIADAFLLHDRPIHMRTDDSVARVVRGRPAVLRRSRGLVPASLPLPVAATPPVLACGGELKSTFCVAKGSRAWVSHHVGDLKNLETLTSFRDGIAHFERLFDVTPEVVAHDLHPDYLSTSYALDRDGVEHVGVQHHHAHLAACLAEHGLTERAVGAIFDGTGFGTDGAVWGGEILVGDLRAFARVGHLHPVRLPGGDRAVREPWRMACAWLAAADLPVPAHLRRPQADAVLRLCRTGFSAPVTTSMGRLFDAVAAMCGLRAVATYEGQAAVELEAAADPDERGTYELGEDLDARPLVVAVAADLAGGAPVRSVSARFHRTVARGTAAACARAASAAGVDLVVLSGGVFQNRLLLTLTADRLEALGLRVLVPEKLPANDGGIAYGQAAIAAARG